MTSYRDLIVWQKSMLLVEKIYQKSNNFPSSETFGLSFQMRKSAVSIPSNIAEGYGRHHSKEYIRFLQIAAGSLYELQTQTEIACRLGYINNNDNTELNDLSFEIEKMLASLIKKIGETKL